MSQECANKFSRKLIYDKVDMQARLRKQLDLVQRAKQNKYKDDQEKNLLFAIWIGAISCICCCICGPGFGATVVIADSSSSDYHNYEKEVLPRYLLVTGLVMLALLSINIAGVCFLIPEITRLHTYLENDADGFSACLNLS